MKTPIKILALAVLAGTTTFLFTGLPGQYRDVLQRVDLGGESPKDAATALGLTLNNLNVRLHRARQRLREKVEATCHVCSKHGCLDCSCGSESGH